MLLAHLSEVDPGQGKAREWGLTFPLQSTGCHLCLRKITTVVNSCTGRKHKQGGGSGRPCRRGQDKGCVVGHPDTLSLQKTLTGTDLTQEKGQRNSQGLPDHMVATELHSRHGRATTVRDGNRQKSRKEGSRGEALAPRMTLSTQLS